MASQSCCLMGVPRGIAILSSLASQLSDGSIREWYVSRDCYNSELRTANDVDVSRIGNHRKASEEVAFKVFE